MIINGQTVNGDKFAYDNCHKIYIIEDQTDIEEAKEIGYDVYPIENLKEIYEHSCELRFISNWKLTKNYVTQFEDCTIE